MRVDTLLVTHTRSNTQGPEPSFQEKHTDGPRLTSSSHVEHWPAHWVRAVGPRAGSRQGAHTGPGPAHGGLRLWPSYLISQQSRDTCF